MKVETPKKHRIYLIPTDCCFSGMYSSLNFEYTKVHYHIEDQDRNSVSSGDCILYALPFYLKKSLLENSISEYELINDAQPESNDSRNFGVKNHAYILNGSLIVMSVNNRRLYLPEVRNIEEMLRLNIDEISNKVFLK